MILFGCLATHVAPTADGALQISGAMLGAPGPSSLHQPRIAPAALTAAVEEFMQKGDHQISEMFGVGPAAGGVDDLVVDKDGTVHLTGTLTKSAAITKVGAGVYRSIAIGIRALARDPADPGTISKVEVLAVSLTDIPDEASFSALTKGLSSTIHAETTRRLSELSGTVLDLSARLRAYERP